jgi:uncharacterized phage-associated protein
MYLTTAPLDARAVANYFLSLAGKDGQTIDPMGIQKLVFFAHGWHLAIYDRPLISQPIEAWDYGPVIRDLYHDFKRFGNDPITEQAYLINLDPETRAFRVTRPELPLTTPPETVSLLDRIWRVYKPFTSIQLSNMTHFDGTPWRTAREHGAKVIDNGTIQAYFKKQKGAHG